MMMMIKKGERGTGGNPEGLKTPLPVGTLEHGGQDPLRRSRFASFQRMGATLEQAAPAIRAAKRQHDWYIEAIRAIYAGPAGSVPSARTDAVTGLRVAPSGTASEAW
jgi:hypothetical protein